MQTNVLEQIPLWGVFCLTAALVLCSIGIGTLLGKRRLRQADHESESSLGTVIGAVMGLLAFMLAFTFSISAERFQTRRELLLQEVNTIYTTYLRAELLREPIRSEVQELLREYVAVRVNLVRQISQQTSQQVQETLNDGILQSEEINNQLWTYASALAAADRSSEIDALFISSLNDMIELHTSRATIVGYRIHGPVWLILYFITVLTMVTVGYQEGIAGKGSIKMALVLAFTFSAVIFLIADLDRITGTLRVNQQPLLQLQHKIQEQTSVHKPAAPAFVYPEGKELSGE